MVHHGVFSNPVQGGHESAGVWKKLPPDSTPHFYFPKHAQRKQKKAIRQTFKCARFIDIACFSHISLATPVFRWSESVRFMKQSPRIRTPGLSSLVPKLLEAGMDGNRQRLELLTLNAIRTFKGEFPDMAEELGSLLSQFTVGSAGMRWHSVEPPPTDQDAGLSLLRMEPVDNALPPSLDNGVFAVIGRFLRERAESERLLQQGFAPPRTILLKGAPGTGKTMLARWVARELKLPLVVLDLATSISSYLGKTGANLRRSLDYARAMPCVLLLDEFDAIAKRRDDATEVGELKRIVNVLLKELEEWPMHSVLVAATNHPELLDPAIHRRFDVVMEVPLPGETERNGILARAGGQFTETLPKGFLATLARHFVGRNGSDLDAMAQVPLMPCFIEEWAHRIPANQSKKELNALAKILKKDVGLSVREIGELIGKSPSTVQYHLGKE